MEYMAGNATGQCMRNCLILTPLFIVVPNSNADMIKFQSEVTRSECSIPAS